MKKNKESIDANVPLLSKRDERRSKLSKILYAEKYIETIWVDEKTGMDLEKFETLNSSIKPGTNCWSEKILPGYFHHYINDYGSHGSQVSIETEDGDMIETSISRIKFVD